MALGGTPRERDLTDQFNSLAERVRKLEIREDQVGAGTGDSMTLPHTTLRGDTFLDGTVSEIPIADVDHGFRLTDGGIVVVWADSATSVWKYSGFSYDDPFTATGPKLTGVVFIGGDTGTYDSGALITLTGAP